MFILVTELRLMMMSLEDSMKGIIIMFMTVHVVGVCMSLRNVSICYTNNYIVSTVQAGMGQSLLVSA